jgi:putative ABC transport system permease protein
VIGTTTSLAFAALLRNKLRSALTMVGIAIGVAAVVMMQSMGQGATAYIGEAISGLGSNMLFVVPGQVKGMQQSTLGVPLFTTGDLEAIRHEAPAVGAISALGSRLARVVHGSNNRSVTVTGVMPSYFEIRGWGVSSGRLLTADDERVGAAVCLIGQTVIDSLFAGRDPIGQEIRVRELSCRVVGVLEAKGAAAFGVDQDDTVMMPYTTFSRRVIGSDRLGALMAAATSADRIDEAKEEMTQILRRRRHILPGDDDNFAVRDPREMQALLESVTGMLTTLLAAVAAVSLVVGGIGIMNIMLVSVTERTREIGVRLAIGARANDILVQFLVEATALSAVGGLIGLGSGLAAAVAAAHFLHVPFVVPTVAMPIAFGMSVLVGVVFGVIPARKASQLHPLTALRYE